jgi:hypothetical protein
MEDLLGRQMTDSVLEGLKRLGIDLSDEAKSYSLHEIKEALVVIFGEEATELLIERIKKDTRKN